MIYWQTLFFFFIIPIKYETMKLHICYVKFFFISNLLRDLKVLQYYGNVKYNLTDADAFAEVVKVTNYTRLWDAKSATHQICLYALEHDFIIYTFRCTWPSLTVEVLTIYCEISWTIWLLYCDQLHLHLLCNNFFWLLRWHYGPVHKT